MHILSIASEAVPFIKTGGLADVAGALPAALERLGHQVVTVLPLYDSIDVAAQGINATEDFITFQMGGYEVHADIWEARRDGRTTYFIDCPDYFGRPHLYGDSHGDYADNGERFAFFAQAALALAERRQLTPDIIHCHDWQSALVPALLKEAPQRYPSCAKAATVLTIHNLAYQGSFDPAILPMLGLPAHAFSMSGIEFHGRINFLKGGIAYADVITTVSRTYAKEIQQPQNGYGLDGLLRHRADCLQGIVNGIDTEVWDPERDPALPATFTAARPGLRAKNRAAILERFGIDPKRRPLIGVVGRLAEQKGYQLLLEALPRLLDMEVALAILGSGDAEIVSGLEAAARRYPEQLGLMIGFDEQVARVIYGGSDLFLMPSQFEPCGLSQLISMRYGSPPIVHRVGGLTDTVTPHTMVSSDATGFGFSEFSADALVAAVSQAVTLFHDSERFRQVQLNAMARDVSWDASAREYATLYRSARSAASRKSLSAESGA